VAVQAAWVSERDPIIQRYWDSAFLTRWDRILPHVPKHRPRQAEIELYITEACMNHIGGVHAATDGAGYRRSWAQVAEAKAREAVEALALVEEPIRKRFCARSSTTNILSSVA
jgi:hypothetical protein